ncbi:MAG: aspartate/glutamate racemase family protein [Bacteroidota bacterium]
MKTIGLIGGMSWESSWVYYELINKMVKERLGGFHSCKSLMYTVDFAEIEHLQHTGDWDALNGMMADAAQRLERGGADLVILCTNTMHLCADAIRESVSIPFLHIAEATGDAIQRQNMKKVGLLGTRFTMERDFYRGVLQEKFGIKAIIPEEADRDVVHKTIYGELVHGKIEDASRDTFKEIIKRLEERGAEGVVLGCTEIPLLIKEGDVDLPIFSTMEIHAEKAVDWALQEQKASV